MAPASITPDLGFAFGEEESHCLLYGEAVPRLPPLGRPDALGPSSHLGCHKLTSALCCPACVYPTMCQGLTRYSPILFGSASVNAYSLLPRPWGPRRLSHSPSPPAPPAQILGVKGRGVFSSVLVAHDTQAVPTSPLGPSPRTVAIKVLRGNDLMLQAGLKEAALLRALTEGDKRDEGHVVRFHEEFRLGGHVCVVMEAMHLNLRKLLKTYGPSQGLAIKAVLSYAQQVSVSSEARLCHACVRTVSPGSAFH